MTTAPWSMSYAVAGASRWVGCGLRQLVAVEVGAGDCGRAPEAFGLPGLAACGSQASPRTSRARHANDVRKPNNAGTTLSNAVSTAELRRNCVPVAAQRIDRSHRDARLREPF